MLPPIPSDKLMPRAAWKLAEPMRQLARWWLRPEVLERAREHDSTSEFLKPIARPQLAEKLGDCWVIFRANEAKAHLRSAFLLPLSWRKGKGHSPFLPPRLVSLADHVIKVVAKEERIGEEWSLHPAVELELTKSGSRGGDYLSKSELRCASGWIALAGGLIACAGGLLPRASIWASGAWNRFGLADIKGLEAKLALAAEWQTLDASGQAMPTEFFVPRWRAPQAERWVERNAPGRVTIGVLDAPPDLKPRKAMNQYLARLTKQPPIPEVGSSLEGPHFQACRTYFFDQPAFSESERSFYRSHLLPSIIHKFRRKVGEVWPQGSASHYVTFVSASPELAVLAALAVNARSCLLLHTRDEKMTNLAQQCQQQLSNEGVTDCRCCPVDQDERLEKQVRDAVAVFTQGVKPEQIVLDLKPGTKKMTYAQSRAAQPENWIFNLEATFLDDRRTDPGTERPELWQADGR